MRSNIFLSDLSVVDHAFINDRGQVIGGSFNPGFIVSGETDPTEKVVVDFSTIKKDIKQSIDKHTDDIFNNGFDHKLWFIEGYSLGSITEKDGRTHINTPATLLSLPNDAVRVIQPINGLSMYGIEFIGVAFAIHVYNDLLEKYPNIDLRVECLNSVDIHTVSHKPYAFFTYSHGLKDSTSYGCQNIAHGHLSYLQHSNDDVLRDVCMDLDGAVFINKDNIIIDTTDTLTVEYTSQRGFFSATYNKSKNKLIVLDTETTVEFLAEYVKNTYDIDDFYISEGLSKGAFVPTL